MGERAARACTRNAVGMGEHARAHNITILQLILLIWVQCNWTQIGVLCKSTPFLELGMSTFSAGDLIQEEIGCITLSLIHI